MNDPSKKVKNPLFNVCVTGGTFEEFSQNAILLPAKKKPPPPTLNLSQEQILSDIISNSSKIRTEVDNPEEETIFSEFSNQSSNNQPIAYSHNLPDIQTQQIFNYSEELPDISTLQPHLSSAGHQNSNLSSVFSSFSNILSIGNSSNNKSKEEIVVPPPAGIANILSQVNNPEPVPLFSSSSDFNKQKPPVSSGPVNVFRRSGLKRPTYAHVPGLSKTTIQTQNNPSQNTPIQDFSTIPVASHPTPQNYFAPSTSSPSNSNSSTFIIEPAVQNLPNQFKPISPLPPNIESVSHIPQPLAPVPMQAGFFPPSSHQSIGSYNKIIGPVMDAIPASELSHNSKFSSTPVNIAATQSAPSDIGNEVDSSVNQVYRPVYHHWFYQREIEEKKIWHPFSMCDSLALEQAFTSNDIDPDKVIATDGGRYDVNILRRQRNAVFWEANPNEVRRCSWFYKNIPDGKLIPYEENIATKLEEEYKSAFESNHWHRTIELSQGESIVIHGPDVLVVYSSSHVPDTWGNTTNQSRPRVVKRGMDEFDIDEGEPVQVDHILFMVHGIGSVCDLKFRSVEEVVEDFRSIAFQLVQSHYKSSCEKRKVNRIEVLPISWHNMLHSGEAGIDERLHNITLESIPKLRRFINDTVLDVLLYTSPIYCQKIISTVGTELNRLYDLYRVRNPDFNGDVSLGGHSLGSLILFDLLCHQHSKPETNNEKNDELVESSSKLPHPQKKMCKRISYMMGAIGTGQLQISYTRLNFEPKNLFALGSPIGMFVNIRGLDTLGENFSLPTCPAFFNIFHPYDPIAYRIESLINPEFKKLNPLLVPHHKGRKRMHLELKETMARVGADFKQKVIDSMKNTWNSVYQLAMFHKQTPPSLEEEVSKAFRNQIDKKEEVEVESDTESNTTPIGNLNGGRRVDYVLQEAPFEFFNEYLFALTSHTCYWESEDTILFILKEIYSSMGVNSDSQIPQQSMTIERPSPSPSCSKTEKIDVQYAQQLEGVDPTKPIQLNTQIQPPPMTGFVRKT